MKLVAGREARNDQVEVGWTRAADATDLDLGVRLEVMLGMIACIGWPT